MSGHLNRHLLRSTFHALSALILLTLVACGGGGKKGGSTPVGTISGTVRSIEGPLSTGATDAVVEGSPITRIGIDELAAATQAKTEGSAAIWSIDNVYDYGSDFVPGEVIVAFEPGMRAAATLTLQASGSTLQSVRSLSLPGAQLYHADGIDPRAAAQELSARPGVLYAQPNYIRYPTQVTPNDPIWVEDRSALWHYDQMNLPDAWAITTGDPNIVVAVVDTGILYDMNGSRPSHQDFNGRVVPGYDFISDARFARDGDGRDPDPFDDGDLSSPNQSSYHGTHVAGTVAAAGNDGFGIPGVSWNAKLLNIRVLGEGGGSTVDIIDGTFWAAGGQVDGVPPNQNPAHVINLSLGGEGACSPYEQQAYDIIAEQSPNKAIVVVAAGNEDMDVSRASPANCRNVITVGASGYGEYRAPYSNYGSRIDVMAPGGDVSVDRNNDGYPDGVLSAMGFGPNGANAELGWEFYQGTSMAAPHVAGLVALMKSIDPNISLSTALQYLTTTARPYTAAQCSRPRADECGAGEVDAAAVLSAMIGGGTPPAPGDPTPPPATGDPLIFNPPLLDFGLDLETISITITNTTNRAISWLPRYDASDPDNPSELQDGWLWGDPPAGVLGANQSTTMQLAVDRDEISVSGAYKVDLYFLELDQTGQSYIPYSVLPIRVMKGNPTTTPRNSPMGVYAFVFDPSTVEGWRPAGYYEQPAPFSEYAIQTEAGFTNLIAWLDADRDGTVSQGDWLGTYPTTLRIDPGANLANIPIVISPLTGNYSSDAEDALLQYLNEQLADSDAPGAAPIFDGYLPDND